ncbi:hypothetical protein MD26_11095 [Pseudomonas sp. H2]|nr:hypothetical protein MD26_11095 [Pseudomonas sp. H2]
MNIDLQESHFLRKVHFIMCKNKLTALFRVSYNPNIVPSVAAAILTLPAHPISRRLAPWKTKTCAPLELI